jgi:hypothetical protein
VNKCSNKDIHKGNANQNDIVIPLHPSQYGYQENNPGEE